MDSDAACWDGKDGKGRTLWRNYRVLVGTHWILVEILRHSEEKFRYTAQCRSGHQRTLFV